MSRSVYIYIFKQYHPALLQNIIARYGRVRYRAGPDLDVRYRVGLDLDALAFSISEQLLRRNVKRFRGGLVLEAHRLVCHSIQARE
jgi:hypothetical protein